MSDWAPQPIRDLIESEWPGEWGTEPAPLTPGVVVYRSTDIDDAGHLNEMDGGAYRSIPAGKLVAKQLRPGDILLEASGGTPDRPVGRVALFAGMRDEPAMSSNFLRTLRPKKSVDCHFACWALLNLHEQPAIWRYQQQTTGIINLKTSDYLGHEVLVPSLARQRRIAEILSTVDEAIAGTEKLIAKHQQIKTGLMHDLFTRGLPPDGHLRPPHTQAPHLYQDAPLGPIPMEWEVRTLGLILDEHGGYLQTGPFGSQLHAHEYQLEGVPVVMPQDIDSGHIVAESIARISDDRARDLSRHLMRAGDIVIARRGELSRAAAISGREAGWLCGTGCFLLRLGSSDLRSEYASYVYRQHFVQRQIAGMAVGTTMPSLNNSVMSRLLFLFCEPEEQDRIVERLSVEEELRQSLVAELETLQDLRQGLMHDLLTGEVKVPIPEADHDG